MLSTRRGFLLAGSAALLSACSPGAISSIAPSTATTPQMLTRDGVVAAINAARQANGGHPPLRYNVQLEQAARSQAKLMASKGQLEHNLGVTLRQRVTAAGYFTAVGENIAGGQQTLEQAILGWLNSPGHRATLLSDKFVEFGLAVESVHSGVKSRYGIYWCFIAGGPVENWIEET
ncbi:MAG: CAP domain-containing protein [Devosia sp.]